MQVRHLVLAGVAVGFIVRLLFSWIMFISASQVDEAWLMWALMGIMSIALTRGIYQIYRVSRFVFSMSKLD